MEDFVERSNSEPSGAIFPALGKFDIWQRAAYEYAAASVGAHPVFDFGCGYGTGTALLASQTNMRVVGIDSDPACIAYARHHYRMPNLSFIESSDVRLPTQDTSIGLITAFKVIEHLSPHDLRRFFLEVRRTLVPGGKLIGQTPNPSVPHREGVRFTRLVSVEELSTIAADSRLSVAFFGQESISGRQEGVLDFLTKFLPQKLARMRTMKVIQGIIMSWNSRELKTTDATVRIDSFEEKRSLTTVFVMTL